MAPHSLDLEETVIGAIMLDRDTMETVGSLLKPESFYKPAHQIIFSTAQTLYNRNEPIDIMTIVQELIKTGGLEAAGGAFAITRLTNRIASSSNAMAHALIIKELFMKRELIRTANNIVAMAYSEESDIFELIENAENSFMAVNEEMIFDTTQTLESVVKNSIKEIEAAMGHTGLTGIASGYIGLDAITHGFQKKKLYILAARPGAGKTSAMLQMAEAAWEHSKAPSLVISIEQDNVENGKKILSFKTGISHKRITRGKLDGEEMDKLKGQVIKAREIKMYIEDKSAMKINALKGLARKYVRKYGVEILFLDYLQIVEASIFHKTREQTVTEVARGLKAISKSLNIPVVALCMLGRSVDERKDKVPILNDLKEAGSIEEVADVVMFLYRPAIHGIFEDANGNDIRDMAKIIIAKHRAGILGSVKLKFYGDESRFESVDSENVQSEIPMPPQESPV